MAMHLPRILLFVAAGLLLPGAIQAQRTLHTFFGKADDAFGTSVRDAGDVNRDGYADVIVGAVNNIWSKSGNYARVFSGKDGAVLHTFKGATGDLFGIGVSGAGDVNKDGYPDLIVGASQTISINNSTKGPGYAIVYSGYDGKPLHTFKGDNAGDGLGFCVSGAGDVNADGYADLIVGADRANGWTGYARVYSGYDGKTLHTFKGTVAKGMLGRAVCGAGDVNQDNHADLLVGSLTTGTAQLYSGKDYSLLKSFVGASESVGAAGDVNGDGYVDVIIGGPGGLNPKNVMTGHAQVFSGKDYKLLHVFYGETKYFSAFGTAVDGVGDVDKDGHADLIVGASNGRNPQGVDTGYARVFSGKRGAVLYTLYGDSSRDYFGVSASGAGDVDKDGIPDLIVGAKWDDNKGTDSGSVRVVSGKAFLSADTHAFSLSKANTQTLTLDAGNTNKGLSYWIFGSVSGTTPGVTLASAIGSVWIPLNPDPWTDITIAFANSPMLVRTRGMLDSSGQGTAWIKGGPVNVPSAVGLVFHHAYLVYDQKNNFYLASNAVPLTLTK